MAGFNLAGVGHVYRSEGGRGNSRLQDSDSNSSGQFGNLRAPVVHNPSYAVSRLWATPPNNVSISSTFLVSIISFGLCEIVLR